MKKLLFICKKRTTNYGELKSSGLLNSARMVVDCLNEHGISSILVDVVDGNCIDRQIHLHKPTHVILEAYWCPPYKLIELAKLHPKVKWTVRNHSKIPFLAGEGISMLWSKEYLKAGNKYLLSSNSIEAVKDFNLIGIPCGYTPNIYNDINHPNSFISNICNEIKGFINGNKFNGKQKDVLNISCFGAIRPLKNQVLQAMAAIAFCDKHNKKLIFHINTERVEMKGNENLKNIRSLFFESKHELVEHHWMDREDFFNVIKNMDLGLQVSLTETFNIVTADFVKCGTPFVASPDIDWAPDYTIADPHKIEDIIEKMETVLSMKTEKIQKDSINNIKEYNKKALRAWKEFLKEI